MPDRPDSETPDGEHRADEIRLHADAYCRCVWCDRPDEAAYHLAEIERLERQ